MFQGGPRRVTQYSVVCYLNLSQTSLFIQLSILSVTLTHCVNFSVSQWTHYQSLFSYRPDLTPFLKISQRPISDELRSWINDTNVLVVNGVWWTTGSIDVVISHFHIIRFIADVLLAFHDSYTIICIKIIFILFAWLTRDNNEFCLD